MSVMKICCITIKIYYEMLQTFTFSNNFLYSPLWSHSSGKYHGIDVFWDKDDYDSRSPSERFVIIHYATIHNSKRKHYSDTTICISNMIKLFLVHSGDDDRRKLSKRSRSPSPTQRTPRRQVYLLSLPEESTLIVCHFLMCGSGNLGVHTF